MSEFDAKKDYCTLFPEKWRGVDIKECCYGHDKTCSTREFYLCLRAKIGKFHATYIGFGGSVGCWVKHTKKMIIYYKRKFGWES